MAKSYVLSWGKPTIVATPLEGTKTPVTFPECQEGSAQLTTTEGSETEAKDLGGNVVDSRKEANTYEFVVRVYHKVGDTDPIPHKNGVVEALYELKLTPENPACRGFMFPKAQVSVVDSWSADEGELIEYHFKALADSDGFMIKNHINGTPEGEA